MTSLKSIESYLLFPPKRVDMEELAHAVEGKTILITGATYGIGECIARMLAPCRVHLILAARTAEKLELLKTDLEREQCRVTIFTANLYHEHETDALVDFLKHYLIDIFINNAGKSIRRPVFDSLERYHDYTRTIAINYFAPVKIVLSLLPGLSARKGQIINISAANVLLAPAANWAAYQASKSAFDQWFRCLLPEMENRGIAGSSVYLPLVRTRMIAPTEMYNDRPAMQPEQVAAIVGRLMINRKKIFRPWWLPPLQMLSVLLRGMWENINRRATKNQAP